MTVEQIIETLKGINDFEQVYADKFIEYIRCVDPEIKNIFFPSGAQVDTKSSELSSYNSEILDFVNHFVFRCAASVSKNSINKVVQSADGLDKYLKQWYSENNATVGRTLVGTALKTYMPAAFSSKTDTAQQLYDCLIQEDVYIGLFNYDEVSEKHMLLPLICGMMYCLDQTKYNDLIKDWKSTDLSERVKTIENYPWTSILQGRLNPDSTTFKNFETAIEQAVSQEIHIETRTESAVVDVTPSGSPVTERYQVDIFRQSTTVYNWMKSVKSCEGYLSGKEPDYQERQYKREAPAPSGCVLADTRIIMKDGSLKPITDIESYDRILNAQRNESICSGEVVKNNHVDFLYSINDDAPFMSLDHLILTASGYKCIDTKTAKELNPGLRIAQLKVGDVVMKYVDGEMVPVIVEQINCKAGNTALCADIHVSDGLKSYITENGYICYANYPEITGQSIMRSVSPALEDFRLFLKENQNTLEQSFGRHAYAYISQLAEKGDAPVTLRWQQPEYDLIASIEHTNYKIHSEAPLGFDTMSIIRGFVFFDDEKKPVPLYINDGEVYWKHSGVTGYVKLYHDGLVIKGHIVKDGKKIDFTGTTSVFFDLKFKPDDTGKIMDFGRYEFGFEQKEIDGQKVLEPVGKWYMSYTEGTGKISEKVVSATGNLAAPVYYAIDHTTHQLYASVQFPTGLAAIQFIELRDSQCTDAKLTFSTLFDSISGNGLKYDETAKSEEKLVSIGKITGVLDKNIAEHRAKLVSALANYLKNSPNEESSLTNAEIKGLRGMYTMDVEDLIRLPVPADMGEIHSQCFNRTLNMAVYAAYESDDTSKDILGIPKPTVGDISGAITKEQADIAVDKEDFLINKFISAYLSFAYIKQGNSPDCDKDLKQMIQPLLDIDHSYDKVYYYMNGNGVNCMPSQEDYSEVTNAVYHSVYKNNVIGLDYFYNNNRETWAKEMYDRLNHLETLIGLVNMQALEPDNAQLTHYYSVLDVLDSSKRLPIVESVADDEPEKYSYATVLRKQVIDASFKSSFSRLKLPDASDKEAVETFEMIICEFFKTYTKAINDGSFQSWDESTLKEAREELQQMAEAYGYLNTEAMVADIMTVAADISGIILSISDPNLSVKIYQLFREHPRITSAVTSACYAFGIAAIGLGFSMLDEMTPVEKAEFALSVADVGINMVRDVSGYLTFKTFKTGLGDLSQAEADTLSRLSKADFLEVLCKNKGVSQSLVDLGITGVNRASTASEFWGKVFRISMKLAKGLMLLTVAVSIGVTGYQLYEDIVNGENPGIVALDSLMILADGVFLVTEAVSCFAASVCAAIPIVGIVAAAVGVVLAIVSIFVKRKPPKSPIEIFVDDRLLGFVNGLEMPPEEWISTHTPDGYDMIPVPAM